MNILRSAACLSLLILVGASGAGCVAVAAAGAAGATAAYVRGNTEGLIEASPDRVLAATEAVFEQMHLKVTDREGEADDRRWQIKGEGEMGDSVKVTVKQLAPEVSKVWVRVGMFGDEQFSRTIFERIKAGL